MARQDTATVWIGDVVDVTDLLEESDDAEVFPPIPSDWMDARWGDDSPEIEQWFSAGDNDDFEAWDAEPPAVTEKLNRAVHWVRSLAPESR